VKKRLGKGRRARISGPARTSRRIILIPVILAREEWEMREKETKERERKRKGREGEREEWQLLWQYLNKEGKQVERRREGGREGGENEGFSTRARD